MKTVKDAVIELCGKLPAEKEKINGWTFYNGRLIYLKAVEQPIVFTPEQFEAESKRLGYINGYRWGVEYPTNGKRPELRDYVLCNAIHKDGERLEYNDHKVVDWYWPVLKAFYIIDQRYKPADTSYLNALTQDQSLTHGEEGLAHGEWWDYENDKAIKLPPVGAECSRKFGDGDWVKTTIVAHHFDGVRAIFCDGGISYGALGYVGLNNFRPLDHATRKAELEREKVIEASIKIDGSITKNQAESLYNAGMLVLPPKKSDTED